ncbi:MAG: tetratricopeptide repeat protein, partial [Ignavibacteriaceae bacterium]|nr:tetratricopeptide repeat protein [Ignavibacteriaceae bacterium]
MIKIHSLFKKILLSFIPAILFFGCGVWGNFTTYFNLYYNAADLFEQAETAIKEQKVDLFSTQELVLPGSANQQLVKVIEKASKILQYHNQTAFVDDALLMLGKSFFYQRNYQKALRKFNELVATRPESGLVLEAELWSGRAEMKLKDYEIALQTLAKVRKKGIDEGEDEIVNQTFVEQIKYYITIEELKKAIVTSNELLNVSDDKELNAIVAFQLGKLYTETDDVENAIVALEKVFEYSPTYETELNASIELGKALREAKKLERALRVFDDLRSEDKYKESYDILDVELGLTYKDLGELDEAVSNLQFADTAYANSLNSGIAKYELGLIFEKNYKNFDSAFYYYSRASKAPAPSE